MYFVRIVYESELWWLMKSTFFFPPMMKGCGISKVINVLREEDKRVEERDMVFLLFHKHKQ